MHPCVRAAVRAAVLAVNTPVAKARLTKALDAAPRPLKIEIGGITSRPGWIITNVNAVTKNYLDSTARWPVEDGAASIVYGDNMIEHITLAGGRAMLAEAHRCLQLGGVIRLVTPDLRAHVDMYLSGAAALETAAAKHYRTYKTLEVEHPSDLVRVPIASFGHHAGYVYDYEALAAELTRAGFRDVIRCDLGVSTHPDLDGLDQSREGGSQIAVEATR